MASPAQPGSTTLDQLRARIQARAAKVGIVGLGYVGLPLALLFKEERFPVTGFDIDADKVQALNKGRSYIYRIPATEIADARGKGFSATNDYAHVAEYGRRDHLRAYAIERVPRTRPELYPRHG